MITESWNLTETEHTLVDNIEVYLTHIEKHFCSHRIQLMIYYELLMWLYSPQTKKFYQESLDMLERDRTCLSTVIQ